MAEFPEVKSGLLTSTAMLRSFMKTSRLSAKDKGVIYTLLAGIEVEYLKLWDKNARHEDAVASSIKLFKDAHKNPPSDIGFFTMQMEMIENNLRDAYGRERWRNEQA